MLLNSLVNINVNNSIIGQTSYAVENKLQSRGNQEFKHKLAYSTGRNRPKVVVVAARFNATDFCKFKHNNDTLCQNRI